MKRPHSYFVVCESTECGWHSGGPDMQFKFIEASTPKDALEKVWKSKVLHGSRYCSYELEVHNNANDYHNHKKPLAKRYRYGEDPDACNNPDCPYC